MWCHSCFQEIPESDFNVSDVEAFKRVGGRKSQMFPNCKACKKRYVNENKVARQLPIMIDPEDYEERLINYCKTVHAQEHKGYTAGDVLDVRLALSRGVLKGDVHIVCNIPRYRVTRILKQERL